MSAWMVEWQSLVSSAFSQLSSWLSLSWCQAHDRKSQRRRAIPTTTTFKLRISSFPLRIYKWWLTCIMTKMHDDYYEWWNVYLLTNLIGRKGEAWVCGRKYLYPLIWYNCTMVLNTDIDIIPSALWSYSRQFTALTNVRLWSSAPAAYHTSCNTCLAQLLSV